MNLDDMRKLDEQYRRFRHQEAMEGAPEIVDTLKSTLSMELAGKWQVKKGERCDMTK